ncbi:MAG: hypothetical protein HQ534_08965 [Armatimonadetes bacterium]|nr:hypothetical protein [Armatimonadota bacterium]
MIQQSNWSIEEKIITQAGNLEKSSADINEMKSNLCLINDKIDRLDLELKALRYNGMAD